jgi:hypothetical protein
MPPLYQMHAESFTSIRIAQEAVEPLIWIRPKPLHPVDALRCGGNVIATLRYHGLFGTRATGDSENGRWTFERQGLRHPRITVRTGGGDAVIGTVELPHLFGSRDAVVRLSHGRSFRWVQFDTSGLRCGFTAAPEGTAIMRFMRPHLSYPWITRTGGDIQLEVAPAAHSLDELPLLALLGRYLMHP